MKNVPNVYTDKTGNYKPSLLFKTYMGRSFNELRDFAQKFSFTIVDSYWSFDNEEKRHVPTVEVY